MSKREDEVPADGALGVPSTSSSPNATNATNAIDAVSLGKRFGRHWALAHVDLAISPGTALLVAGANGSGKTTLLRLVAGLYQPSRGSIRVFGTSMAEDRLSGRRELTLISHDSCLYDGLTPREMLQAWARLGGSRLPAGEDDRLLVEAGLADRADVLISGFSAGMRRRLTLLRIRLENPRVLLLDEPFSALDVEGRRLVADWIREFHAKGGTLLIASHDLQRTAPLCDQAIVVERGQVVWTGPAAGAESRREGGE